VSRPQSSAKRVTWAELFFDLVFVFAVTEVSALLHADHTWAGVGRALVLFVPLWWAWVGTTVHANTHDVDNAVDRAGIFAVGLCSLFMALAVPEAYGDRAVLFGAGYLALRGVLAFLFFRRGRIVVNSFSVGLVVTGPLLLAGGFAPGGWRLVLWALAGLVDLSVPAIVRRRLALIRFDADHMPERFGLFVIIALGESIVAIGANASHRPLDAARLTAVALAFAVACALWWVYFAFAVDAFHHAVATAEVQTDIIRQVLAYGHLLLIASIIAVAVGLAESVAEPAHPLATGVTALLFGGCALYLATFGYTRWRMFRTMSWTRVGAAVVCLAVLAPASRVPALGALAVLTALVAGLNLVEASLVRRIRRAYAAAHPAPVDTTVH
jgi:low temperature requirement protein LtrA